MPALMVAIFTIWKSGAVPDPPARPNASASGKRC